jgi:hypothetical protein
MKMVKGTERLEQGTMRSNWILDMSDNITPRYTETVDGRGTRPNNVICGDKGVLPIVPRRWD